MFAAQETLKLFKALLALLSAFAFAVSCTPPNGPPTIPPRPSLRDIASAEMREWITLNHITYILPVEVKLYWLASLNEVRYIFLEDSVHLPPTFLTGAILSIFGGIIRYITYRTLATAFTFEVVPAGARSKDPLKLAKLITHGPYSIIRHPSYAGTVLNLVGSIMVHLVEGSWIRSELSGAHDGVKFCVYTWLSIISAACILIMMRMGHEDRIMKDQFGEDWIRWSRNVPYKIIPGVC
ncbi:hypothetical protein VNI00_000444 [Paramarasmius palmivorus]|uniref:Protein-S-isoprenylcysteine O-methyltransferase n=1 Tax=Paramarasmius palmivorus TaxID=297713 RepID=A0AAW0E848_9AGAR